MWETIGPKWQALLNRKKERGRALQSPESTKKAVQDMAIGVDQIKDKRMPKIEYCKHCGQVLRR